MKVLFAVNNDKISNTIVNKYKELYDEEITYKNVYFFNALIAEIKKDKSYDRIVISEELEMFLTTNYDELDKFIFEKLDAISDEADETEIILICTDRRNKKDAILNKFFSIGIYNVLVGDDRSISHVCKLIHTPRTKKEAKQYIKFDSDLAIEEDNENKVSELELKNILTHYKKLGNNYAKYDEAFKSIALQYNYSQLKIIISILPKNVRDVLNANSEKYREILNIISSMEKVNKANEESQETPKTKAKKKSPKKSTEKKAKSDTSKKAEAKKTEKSKTKSTSKSTKSKNINTIDIEETPKNQTIIIPGMANPAKTKRLSIKQELGTNKEKIINLEDLKNEHINKTIKSKPSTNSNKEYTSETELGAIKSQREEIIVLDETYEEQETQGTSFIPSDTYTKVVPFVGASKVGTTFIVNMLAQYFSIKNVKTAILDLTYKKSTYYIYTDNKEELRQVTFDCLQKLSSGIEQGLKINNNLTVFTSLPGVDRENYNIGKMLSTLCENYQVVLIDTDFTTPVEVFQSCEEIYAVQDMDILNIQDLTLFLREIKSRKIPLDKVKIVINKFVNKCGLTEKMILGGISNYNDPQMKFMDHLFNVGDIKSYKIPFFVDSYKTYIRELVNCKLDLRQYDKEEFKNAIKVLANNIYNISKNKGKNGTKTDINDLKIEGKLEDTLNKMKDNI